MIKYIEKTYRNTKENFYKDLERYLINSEKKIIVTANPETFMKADSIKEFDQTDSVYIFKMSNSCRIIKFGYAKNEDTDLIIVD